MVAASIEKILLKFKFIKIKRFLLWLKMFHSIVQQIAGHLSHPQAHGFLIAAQTLQTESKLVPDLVGHDLVIGVLHNIADF